MSDRRRRHHHRSPRKTPAAPRITAGIKGLRHARRSRRK